MNTNAWVRIVETLAQEWRAWAQWNEGGRVGPEPPLDDFARELFLCVVDWRFSFEAYKLATINETQWRMGNFHGVTAEQLRRGYSVYPGQWEVVGMWHWAKGNPKSVYVPEFPWDPAEAILFMPDVCVNEDCSQTQPATEITDVSLIIAQPPREFLAQPSKVQTVEAIPNRSER